jgi:hypothetical protein
VTKSLVGWVETLSLLTSFVHLAESALRDQALGVSREATTEVMKFKTVSVASVAAAVCLPDPRLPAPEPDATRCRFLLDRDTPLAGRGGPNLEDAASTDIQAFMECVHGSKSFGTNNLHELMGSLMLHSVNR